MSNQDKTSQNTIKDVYNQIKDHKDSHIIANQYRENIQNQLRVVFWETTAGCNLECIHCRRLDVAREMMKDDLTTDESFRLLDQIAETGKSIVILSGGEPLIRPDIFKIAAYGSNIGLTMAMGSNGTLINEDMAERIKASGIQRVSISIDGANAATHDSFRKHAGSFDATMGGLKNLVKAGVGFQINCSIANHNVTQVQDIYQLALDMGAEAFHIFMLVPVGCGLEIADDQMLNPTTYESVLNWLYDISKEKKIQTKATCAPHYFRIMRQRAKKEGVVIKPQTHGMGAMTKGCLAGTSVCFVSHKGEVFPCGYFPVEAGNIRTQTLKNIWQNSEVFVNLRDSKKLQGKCGVCEYNKFCGGCRARAYYDKGNYLAEEPYCIYKPLSRGQEKIKSPKTSAA
jgi:heme b synthase